LPGIAEASTGTPALFVHPAEASHGDLGMITKADVILALSWSGETAELKNLTDYSRRHNIGLIAMTASADSTLAKAADVVLPLPQADEMIAAVERELEPHRRRLAEALATWTNVGVGAAVLPGIEAHGTAHVSPIARP